MSEEIKNKVSLQDIWPQEKDIIYRPDRLKYVRKLVKNEHCVFCEIYKKGEGVESLCLEKRPEGAVILNRYPYNTGHLLIITSDHEGDLSKIKKESLAFIFESIKKSTQILKKVFECEGFNVGLNLGKVAGSSIPDHLHWHVIPRWFGDTNFFPLVCETKVLPETLEQVYEKLKPHYEI